MLEFIQLEKNKEALNKRIHEDERYKQLSEESAQAIKVLTHSDFTIHKEEGGTVDMCKALDDMKKEAREEALKEAAEDKKKALKSAAEDKENALKSAKNEDIKAAYKLAKIMDPDATEKTIIRNLAKVYHKTQKAIRSIVL